MINEPYRRRLWDGHSAVVWRGRQDVIIDRDKLTKRKEDSSQYPLANCTRRWILYTDNHPRFLGEWQAFTSKRKAIETAEKRFDV
jgi:hypothetical protein